MNAIKEKTINGITIKYYNRPYVSYLWVIFIILRVTEVINTPYDWLIFFGSCVLDYFFEAIARMGGR